jgi:predicted PurR-regulated permease PerM
MDQRKDGRTRLEDGGLLALIIVVTIAFAWLIAPFFGAILWGLIASILSAPIYRDIAARTGGRRTLAAAITLLMIVALVILPAILLAVSLVQEAANLYARMQAGDIDIGRLFSQFRQVLPPWGVELLDSTGLTNMETAREMLGNSIATILQAIASRALWFGQGALELLAALGIMLYMTFFLLRDGDRLSAQVRWAMPLDPVLRDRLIGHFVTVVRATMKGTVVVAIVQGTVGGIIFWFLGIDAAILWGLLMALFSLLPAIGTGIVWVPVAIYLFATGSVFEGVVLVICGLFVIGMIDNILRPILVGHETRLPEFVVLVATLSGLKLMGLTGVVAGPIIAALFMAVWIIAGERRDMKSRPDADVI